MGCPFVESCLPATIVLERRDGTSMGKILPLSHDEPQSFCQFFLPRFVTTLHHRHSSACQSGSRFEPSLVSGTNSSSSPSTRLTQICHGPSGAGARQKSSIFSSGE